MKEAREAKIKVGDIVKLSPESNIKYIVIEMEERIVRVMCLKDEMNKYSIDSTMWKMFKLRDELVILHSKKQARDKK